MNKNEFLSELRAHLAGLPEEDVARSLAYYREMIEDRIEDGITEEEAVSAVGSVEEIAKNILSEIPLSKIVRLRAKARRALGTSEVVALAIGSPLWLTAVLVVASLVVVAYAVLWSLVAVLYAVNLSLAACSLTVFFAPVLLVWGRPIAALLVLGVALVCAGLAIFLSFASKHVTLLMVRLSKKILLAVKARLLKRREEAK